MSISNKRDIELIIFSVEQADETKQQNAGNSERMQAHLEDLGVSYEKIIGSYKGQLETSFIVSKSNFIDSGLDIPVFNKYNQESILRVKKDNQAELIYADNSRDIIGYLKQVVPAVAINNFEDFSLSGNRAYVIQ